MRLRTFTAPDMPTAMRQVREALGEDAIILSSEPDRGRGIKIIAAVDGEEPSSPATSHVAGDLKRVAPDPRRSIAAPRMTENSPAADELRFELQNILRFHNLPELFVAKIIQKASDTEMTAILSLHSVSRERTQANLLRMALERLLTVYFPFETLAFPSAKIRGVMLVGPPGAGKTVAIAKLATKLAMDKHDKTQELAIFTTDNKRAGGVEQLQAFTQILNLPLIAAGGDQLRKHITSLPKHTLALIDTAGCNPYDAAEMEELKACAALPGIEPVMVLPAGGDSLEAIDMVEAFANVLPVKRLLLTHADMARRFGGALAAAAAHGLSFSHAGASASIVDSLQPLGAGLLAQFLLRYQLQMEGT